MSFDKKNSDNVGNTIFIDLVVHLSVQSIEKEMLINRRVLLFKQIKDKINTLEVVGNDNEEGQLRIQLSNLKSVLEEFRNIVNKNNADISSSDMIVVLANANGLKLVFDENITTDEVLHFVDETSNTCQVKPNTVEDEQNYSKPQRIRLNSISEKISQNLFSFNYDSEIFSIRRLNRQFTKAITNLKNIFENRRNIIFKLMFMLVASFSVHLSFYSSSLLRDIKNLEHQVYQLKNAYADTVSQQRHVIKKLNTQRSNTKNKSDRYAESGSKSPLSKKESIISYTNSLIDTFGFPIGVRHRYLSSNGYSHKDFTPNLDSFQGRHSVTRELVQLSLNRNALTNFIKMKNEASKTQVILIACTGYRGLSFQTELKKNYPHRAADPGYSEHHLGTAIDIIGVRWDNKSYLWLKKNASNFGFILPLFRGHKQKGLIAEANHWRYVGKQVAKEHQRLYGKNY